jgi:hypothetical protein
MDHESARNKAMRRWHNNHINNSSKVQYTDDERNILNHEPPTSIAREMMNLIREKNTEIVYKYLTYIEARRITLLKEKLRRLKESESNKNE